MKLLDLRSAVKNIYALLEFQFNCLFWCTVIAACSAYLSLSMDGMRTGDPGFWEGCRANEKKFKLSRFTTFFCSRRRRRRKFEKGKFFCIDLFHPRDGADAGGGGVGRRRVDWAGVVASGGGN